MLLKCHECGHENQLGAIFCRECGAKLDVEKMRPEVKNSKPKGSIVEMVKNLVAIVVLLGLFGTIGMMFWPDSPVPYELDKKEQTKANAKLQGIINKIKGEYGDEKYVFTPDEVTYLFNHKLTEKEEGGGYAIDNMIFEIDDYDNIIITANAKMFGSIPVSFQVTGMLEGDTPALTVTGTKMGHLPIPSFAREKIISKFTPVMDSGSIKDIIDATVKLTIENGDFHIQVKQLEKK